jgi:hypothetical protein
MTAKLYANPSYILDESFDPSPIPPADLAQIIEAGIQEYEEMPKFTKTRRLYRNAINFCIETLTDKRNFCQYSFLK